MTLLESLLDAIIRLDGEALVMHVGEKPYVITTSRSLSSYRGPLSWGQVELSSRPLTSDAVLGMLGQMLTQEQRRLLYEVGAVEDEIDAPGESGEKFIVTAARGGDDVWVEVRRKPRPVEPAIVEAQESPALPGSESAPAMPSVEAAALTVASAEAASPAEVIHDEAPSVSEPEPVRAPEIAAEAVYVDATEPPEPGAMVAEDIEPSVALVAELASGAMNESEIEFAPELEMEVLNERDWETMLLFAAELEPPLEIPLATSLPADPVREAPRQEDSDLAPVAPILGPAVSIEEPPAPAADVEAPTVIEEPPAPVPSSVEHTHVIAAAIEEPIPIYVEPPAAAQPVADVVLAVDLAMGAPPEPHDAPQTLQPEPVAEQPAIAMPVVSMEEPPAPAADVEAPTVIEQQPDPVPAFVEHPHVVTAAIEEPIPIYVEPPAAAQPVADIVLAVDLAMAAPPEPHDAPQTLQPEPVAEQPAIAMPVVSMEEPPAPAAVVEVATVIEQPDPVPAFVEHPHVIAAATEEPIPIYVEPPAAAQPMAPVASMAPQQPPAAFAFAPTSQASEEPPVAVVVPMARPSLKLQPPQPPPPVSAASTEASLVELMRTAVARGAAMVYAVEDSRPMIRIDAGIATLGTEPLVSGADVERFAFEFAPREQVADDPSEWTCAVPGVGRVRCVRFRDQSGAGLIFHLPSSTFSTIDLVGLDPQIEALCEQADGLVVVAGARSSGKSTLLGAFVDLINRTRNDHVITIESEIRLVHAKHQSFISQREVQGDGEALAAAARAALREGPDVLVIEDLRAPEAIAVALDGARSGRLVFGAIAAPTAAVAVQRLIDAFAADRRPQVRALLASALRAVVAQVLVERPGRGRVAARELLLSSPAVSKLVLDGATDQLPIAIDGGRRLGMKTMVDSLGMLVREGIVEAAAACRRAPDRAALVAALRRDGIDVSGLERRA